MLSLAFHCIKARIKHHLEGTKHGTSRSGFKCPVKLISHLSILNIYLPPDPSYPTATLKFCMPRGHRVLSGFNLSRTGTLNKTQNASPFTYNTPFLLPLLNNNSRDYILCIPNYFHFLLDTLEDCIIQSLWGHTSSLANGIWVDRMCVTFRSGF